MKNKKLSNIKHFIISIVALLNLSISNTKESTYIILITVLGILLLFIDIINSREGNKLMDISLNLLTSSFLFIGLINNINIILILLALFIFLTYYNVYKEQGKTVFKLEVLKNLRVILPIFVFMYHIYKTSPGPISINLDSIITYTLIILIILFISVQIKSLESKINK